MFAIIAYEAEGPVLPLNWWPFELLTHDAVYVDEAQVLINKFSRNFEDCAH